MALCDYSEYDPEDLDSGKQCDALGKATLMVQGATEKDGDKGPYYAVTFEILAHDDEDQVGREFFQFFNLAGGQSKQTMKLALALGVITVADVAESKLTGSKALDIDLEHAEGRIACGEITQDKAGKFKPKIWDWYNPTSPQAKKFPKPTGEEKVPVEPEPKVAEVDPVAAPDDDDEIPF